MSVKRIFFTYLFIFLTFNSFSISKNYRNIQLKARISQASVDQGFMEQDFSIQIDTLRQCVNISGNQDFEPDGLMSDILNWFDDCLGLEKNGYINTSNIFSEDSIMTTWISRSKDTLIPKVITFSDSKSRITRAIMYISSGSILADTKISSYKYINDLFIPTKITTQTYEDDRLVMTTTINFSEIQLNKEYVEIKASGNPIAFRKSNDFFPQKTAGYPTSSAKIGILSITTDLMFNFYKKFITNQDMSSCSYYPSCSQYMKESIHLHGIGGIIKGLERLERCTSTEKKRNLYPLTKDGHQWDPVK